MNCDETRRLLEADLDGELDLVRHLDLATHLRDCPDCARIAENARARRTALREALPRFTAPPALAERIRSSLPSEARPSAQARTKTIAFPLWKVTGLAASFAVVLFAGYIWGTAHAQRDRLFAEAIGDHVRSLQADHLTDVASTDQHTVKPWFAGKLSFSPPVVDLATVGFPLIGGRLERLDGHTVAALVFHRRKHAVNLFIWPSDGHPLATRTSERDGYHATSWTRDGMNFLAVSEIPASDLAQFAEVFQSQTR